MPADEFVAMVSNPAILGNPLLETQHFIGATRWEKTGKNEITGYHQLRVPHQRYTDETRTNIAVKGHAHGHNTHWYKKVNGKWKFAGLHPDIRWFEYDLDRVFEVSMDDAEQASGLTSQACKDVDYPNEYEPNTTVYTLTVYTPPRPPPRWLPAFLTRENVDYRNYVQEQDFLIHPDPAHYPKGGFGPAKLRTMKTKQVKIRSHQFPADVRCQHVQGKSRMCKERCYLLEKPIEKHDTCERDDCQGHVYWGKTKKADEGVSCFGKKGERLVALVRMLS
jgi:hypothetical protein